MNNLFFFPQFLFKSVVFHSESRTFSCFHLKPYTCTPNSCWLCLDSLCWFSNCALALRYFVAWTDFLRSSANTHASLVNRKRLLSDFSSAEWIKIQEQSFHLHTEAEWARGKDQTGAYPIYGSFFHLSKYWYPQNETRCLDVSFPRVLTACFHLSFKLLPVLFIVKDAFVNYSHSKWLLNPMKSEWLVTQFDQTLKVQCVKVSWKGIYLQKLNIK